jgi:hypothetical protein
MEEPVLTIALTFGCETLALDEGLMPSTFEFL